jgi:hypothetical protein
MKKWEYMIIKDNLTITQLNELGTQGWEVVCYYDHSFLIKRELA